MCVSGVLMLAEDVNVMKSSMKLVCWMLLFNLIVAGRAVQRGVDGRRLEILTQIQIKLFSKLRYSHTKKVD